MKKKHIYSSLVAVCFAFSACDYVDTPQPSGSNGGNGPTGITRNVLIEDYTGHTCGNCPAAAIELDNIKKLYGNKVVGVGIHAGFFAKVKTAPFDYDFNTTAGTEYDNFFGISKKGNPNGMVNRKDYPSTDHIKAYKSWSTLAAATVNTLADAEIKIETTYDSLAKTVSIVVDVKAINALTGDYKLQVWITEDSIIKPQKDYTKVPDHVDNYVHRHVLRGDVNSSWGEQVIAGSAAASSTYKKTYSKTLDPSWKPEHCAIVAFLYNATTYEVIQVEEEHVAH